MLSIRAISALAALFFVASVQATSCLWGYVSVTLKPTRIYASPSTRSRAYSRLAASKRLLTTSGPHGFRKVLLRDGTYGFAPASAIKVSRLKLASSESPRSVFLSRSGSLIARYGLKFEGSPYEMGGTNVSTGIDCSAFVRKLYGDVAGIKLPRTAAEQALVGDRIRRHQDLRPGDRLYFWDKSRNIIGHTGVYIGGNRFVHSSHGRGGVAVDYLTEKWQHILRTARRG